LKGIQTKEYQFMNDHFHNKKRREEFDDFFDEKEYGDHILIQSFNRL
jgi:hypothetical protein